MLFRLGLLFLFGCLFFAAADDSFRPGQRSGPPKDLFEAASGWETLSGNWTIEKKAATATAGDVLAKLSTKQAERLSDRWLTVKVKLTGPSAKAGVWFSGVQTKRAEPLGFVLDAASGSLGDGAGRSLSALPPLAADLPRDLVFNFTPEKVSVHSGNTQLAEVEIAYPETTATVSLSVERGAAVFQELLLAAEAPAAPPVAGTPPVVELGKAVPLPMAPAIPPAAGRPLPARAAPVVTREALKIDLIADKLTPLKSGWNEYFGVHFETAVGPWRTVRQFDGPDFARPAADRHTGEVKSLPGPFAGVPVETSLADFRDWKKPGARGLHENLPTLIQEDRGALFIAPWSTPIGKAEQDEIWALMKNLYGAHVGAEGRVFFQWGDDINTRRLGTVALQKIRGFAPRGGAVLGRGSNIPVEAAAYAEKYLAPAVEAVRRASEEIYRDPAKIPILLGSCAQTSQLANRAWFASVLEHRLSGDFAPSLKGKRVADIVDTITVNYPFVKGDATPLQELWDRFGGEGRGLWVTEEFGPRGRGAANLLRIAGQYLAWAAKNQLDARRTRLFWNLPEDRLAPGIPELVRTLGQSFGHGPLRVGTVPVAGGDVFCIAAGDQRILLVSAPAAPRRGKRQPVTTELQITLTAAQAKSPWKARYLPPQLPRDPVQFQDTPVEKVDALLKVGIPANTADAWVVILEGQ